MCTRNNCDLYIRPTYMNGWSMRGVLLSLHVIATHAIISSVCRCETSPCGSCPQAAGPIRGSVLGGTRLLVDGSGFSYTGGNQLFVGTATASTLWFYSSSVQVVADTPPVSSDLFGQPLPITVVADEVQMPAAAYFVYDPAYTPAVTSAAVVSGTRTLWLCGNLTLTGGTSPGPELASVNVAGVPCAVSSSELMACGTNITCILGPSTPGGPQPVSVRVPLGYCAMRVAVVIPGTAAGALSPPPPSPPYGPPVQKAPPPEHAPPASPPPPPAPPPPPISKTTTAVATPAWLSGGETVTFSLSSAVSSVTEVYIEGVSCTGLRTTQTKVVCTAGPPPAWVPPTRGSACLVMGADGSCVGAEIGYVRRWSAPSTWPGGVIPVSGTPTAVPVGMRVLLDSEAGAAGFVDVEGALVVEDRIGGVRLTATHVVVRSGGLFSAVVLQNDFVLSLGRGLELPVFGQKVLGVADGTLELVGQDVGLSWTRLTHDAVQGATTLQVAGDVNAWPPGASVAVATSGMGSGGTQVLHVVTASSSGILVLDGPLLETRKTGAEVALLSRSVTVSGIDVLQGVGAHVMLAAEGPTASVHARLVNAAFTNVGQSSQLGRYPIHMHMLGDGGSRMIIDSCVVSTGFNRGFAVHGTKGATVTNNVAFDIYGHAFFLEDGTETGNTFSGNLALQVRPSYAMLATDTVPGGFWITNTDNVFENNVVADVEKGEGFWIDPQLGAFVVPGSAPDPKLAPVRSFSNNAAHSIDQYGARVLLDGAPAGSKLVGFSAYGCAVSGFIAVRLGVAQLVDFVVESGPTAAVEVIEAVPAGGALVRGVFSRGAKGSVGVVMPAYLDGFVVDGASFSGFSEPDEAALGVCDHCGWVNSQTQGANVVHVKSLKFVPSSQNRLLWTPFFNTIIRDEDGSLGGAAAYYVHDAPHLRSVCTLSQSLQNTLACSVPAAGLSVHGFSDCALEYQPALIANCASIQSTTSVAYGDRFLRDPTNGWAAVVVPGYEWAFWMPNADWTPGVRGSGGVNVEVDDLGVDSWLVVRMQTKASYAAWNVYVPDVPETFGRQNESFCTRHTAGSPLSRVPRQGDPHGSWFYEANARQLHLLFVSCGEGTSRTLRITPVAVSVGPAVVPMAPSLSSLVAPTSISNGDLVVAYNQNMMLSGSMTVTGTLYIMGALTVTGTSSLTAGNIVVHGSFSCVNHALTITLNGATPPALPETLPATSGMFACLGTCTLTGAARVPWARAASGAGSSMLIASSSVDWVVGDKLAVSTGPDFTTHTVTSVSGSTLSVAPALPAPLAGTLRNFANGLALDTRTEVALITRRSISVAGVPRCALLVAGTATISHVSLDGCGVDGVMPALGVGMQVASDAGPCTSCILPPLPPLGSVVLDSISVTNSAGGGVYANGALSFSMASSAVVGTVGTAIQVVDPSAAPSVTNSLVMAARSSGSDPPDQQPTSCFAICSTDAYTYAESAPCVASAFSGNACAGSADVGFALHAGSCESPPAYSENVAHHALAGVLFHSSRSKCSAAGGVSAYACSEVAIPSLYGQSGYATTDVRLSSIVAASVPGTVAASGGFECPTENCTFQMTSSVIVGGTFLWNAFMPSGSTFPRQPPVLPYYTGDADATWGGSMLLSGVTFVDGASVLGGTNPDSSAPLRLQGSSFDSARPVFLKDPDPAWRDDSNCGTDTDCTGPRALLLDDVDASLSGVPSAQILSNTATLLSGDARCAFKSSWNAYLCRGTTFRMLYLESMDQDKLTRRLWPVVFTQPSGFVSMAGFMDHLWNGGWTSLLRLNRYGVPVESSVSVSMQGSTPRSVRVQLAPAGARSAGGAVVNIGYGRPEVPFVSAGARVYAPPSATDAHGTWFWDNPARSLSVVLQPGAPALTAELTDLVMVSLTITVTDAAFWSAPTPAFLQYVAYSLNIPQSSVVVAGAASSTGSSGRRRLSGSSSGHLDLAIVKNGASDNDLKLLQSSVIVLFSKAVGNQLPGGVVVSGVTRTFASVPFCDGETCFCPDTGTRIPLGLPCMVPPSSPPPPASPQGPQAPPSAGSTRTTAPLVAGLCVGLGVPTLAATTYACVRVRHGTSVRGPRNYAWVRRRVMTSGMKL